jgi:hypothetical protein
MDAGILGIPRGRAGSGTSWQPDTTPLDALHAARGRWRLMLHGNLFVHYLDEGSDRGDEDAGSVNWLMGMAHRPLAGGELTLRAMLSAEAATLGECGYPVLLATGETCEGRPLHDRQHPHDALMEVAAALEREIAPGLAAQAYVALSGEPALGPPAYPHRASSLPNPFAPIGHHWHDATHISFGVVTAGVFGATWKAEGSLFNGREPDEGRWDLDLAPLDSHAGRLWWLPDPEWALQVSGGHLEEAERDVGHGTRVDVERWTASATWHRRLAADRLLATTLAWGRNEEEGRATGALLVEGALDLTRRDTLFARAERAEKTGHDLALEDPALEDRTFAVASLLVGYARQVGRAAGWALGVGGKVSASRVPAHLEPFYGTDTPLGWGVFLSARPAPGGHGPAAH